jgi:hypothetical protein
VASTAVERLYDLVAGRADVVSQQPPGPPLGPPPRPNPPLATDVTGRDSNGLGEQGKTPKTENAPRDHGSLRSAVDQRVFPSFLGSSGHSL